MTTVLPQIDPGNTYSFGSSTTLGTQIKNGAPADVLMSANTTVPASLYAAGVVEKPVNFTRNTLAVVVPKSNPAGIKSIYDLTKPGIKIDEAASSVPVGSYTVQVLTQMGINTQIQANVVSKETSDAGVVAKVALGQVDAGFVYLSDYVIDPTAPDADQGARVGAAEDHLCDGDRHEEPEPGGRAGLDGQGPEPGRPGGLRQGRLPAAHGTRPDDHEGRARACQGGRDGHAHRHQLHRHDVGHDSGRPGEVQGGVGGRS